jgi:hypothetical protein
MDRVKAVHQTVLGSVSLQDVAVFCQEGKLQPQNVEEGVTHKGGRPLNRFAARARTG